MTEIRDGRQVIAQVSRAWFRLRDTYGVDVAPEENDALIICIAICLDRIHYDEDRRQPRVSSASFVSFGRDNDPKLTNDLGWRGAPGQRRPMVAATS